MYDFSNALSYYQKALEIREKALPSNHPDIAYSYNNIGTVYLKMGDYLNALTFCDRASRIVEGSVPENHPVSVTVRQYLQYIRRKIQSF